MSRHKLDLITDMIEAEVELCKTTERILLEAVDVIRSAHTLRERKVDLADNRLIKHIEYEKDHTPKVERS